MHIFKLFHLSCFQIVAPLAHMLTSKGSGPQPLQSSLVYGLLVNKCLHLALKCKFNYKLICFIIYLRDVVLKIVKINSHRRLFMLWNHIFSVHCRLPTLSAVVRRNFSMMAGKQKVLVVGVGMTKVNIVLTNFPMWCYRCCTCLKYCRMNNHVVL